MKATTLSTVPMSRSDAAVLSPILLWAALGTLMTAFSLWVFGQWFTSADAFARVPLTEADAMQPLTLALLRGVEVISTSVAVWALWHYLFKPWIRTGHAPITGLALIGALITYVFDTTINFHDFHMSFNKHSFNFGTWAAGFPGHTGPTHYAEAWFWGPPMYLYFGIAVATLQLKVLDVLKPRAGSAAAWIAAFVTAFLFDLAVEPSIINFAEGYSWPYTVGALSLWSGTQFQFPLYESLFVAIYGSLYTLLMRSERDRGISFIERGVERLPSALRLPTRLLAVTGYASIATMIYFGGFYAFSQFADSRVAQPSYLMYGDADWAPPSK